jgi:hypothetical protein
MRRIRLEDTIRVDSFGKRVWDLTWGLVLVVGLTVISACGLRLGYSKTSPEVAAPVVSQPMGPLVK